MTNERTGLDKIISGYLIYVAGSRHRINRRVGFPLFPFDLDLEIKYA